MDNTVSTSPNTSGVIENQDFYCDGISGVTFKIPVFKNWDDIKVKKINENFCSIEIGWSGFAEIPPGAPPEMKEPVKPAPFYVEVKKSSTPEQEWESAAVFTNPQGIKYRFLNSDPELLKDDPELDLRGRNFVEFYLDNSFVKIESPAINDYYGFSAIKFWKTITETFKLTTR